MPFTLSPLPYPYDALEPHIDARTMEIHYSKHHQGYTNNLNKAVEGTPAAQLSIEKILAGVSQYAAAVRNNAGGYYNHLLFWDIMSGKGGGQPKGALGKEIQNCFGSFDEFRKQFSSAAATRFGSGWAWLVKTPSGLKITSTPNQDNPLMDVAETKGTPVLGLDVWEHAYYLTYQNRRPDYIEAWWNVVNWEAVSRRYENAK